jgi:hypothetical protein
VGEPLKRINVRRLFRDNRGHLMQAIILILVVGVVAVLMLDTIGSIASRRFGFQYGSLSILSWVLGIGTGFFAARYGSLSLSLLIGGIVAFIDATLGWYISWIIGPGRPKNRITAALIAKTVLIVTLTGAALGFVGGLLA